MEVAAAMAQVATVTQLVGNANSLIGKIKQAAEMARQNERECGLLAARVSVIEHLLRSLPKDPAEEVRLLLGSLGDTLKEAHELVESCAGKERNAFKKFFTATKDAERQAKLVGRFQEINSKINSDLLLFSVINHGVLNQIQAQLDGLTTTAPSSPGASGFLQLPAESAQRFTCAEIAVATQYFSHVLGDGEGSSAGTVYYKGCLHDGRDVAVKVLENEDTFVTEVGILSPLRRGNIVPLLGFCSESEEEGAQTTHHRMLVYEYMDNGTLRDHLHGGTSPATSWTARARVKALRRVSRAIDHLRGGSSTTPSPATTSRRRAHVEALLAASTRAIDHLCGGSSSTPSPVTTSWTARVEALLGAARAIDHLHRHSAPRVVVHRNVTSSNILFDTSWTPRLWGFGASVVLLEPTGGEHQSRPPIAEAMAMDTVVGYLDPVYERTKIVGPASDVYSFGVVMLEALTGKPPVNGNDNSDTLSRSLPPIIDAGRLRDVLDGRPVPKPTAAQLEALELVAKTAVRCLWPENRPAIGDVVANLEKALKLILCS